MEVKDGSTIHSAVINKAIDFIYSNLDKDITVDDVAKHCGYSKYHLMRMFKEDTDEALYQFIKRGRLERSAWRLKVEKEKSVTEIGVDYGYSASNFATAFKKQLNVSPADFRKKSELLVEQSSFSNGYTVDDLEDSSDKITVSPNDPEIKNNPNLLTHFFEGGKYAVYHFNGFPQFLYLVYQEIFCRWLQKTGNELDSRPIIDIYRAVGEDGYMEIDICFPIK